jgi:hypothetical protein
MNNFEKIKDNWGKFESLCKRLSDDNLDNCIDELGERILACPASIRVDQYGCYPGGLVDHALKVTATMRKLNDAYNLDLSVSSILKTGLLHDIGKIGDLTTDNFIEEDSSWHREKLGKLYKFNEDLNRMSVSHRTLCILQNFGIVLTSDEWLAIQLSQGSHFEENRFYVGHEPTLAIILQQAKTFVIHSEK